MYQHEDVLKYLSNADKEELALWESLFDNGGWKLLIKAVQANHESALAVINNAHSWEAYVYNKGARDALETVLNLESSLEFAVQQKIDRAKAGNDSDVIEEAAEEYI